MEGGGVHGRLSANQHQHVQMVQFAIENILSKFPRIFIKAKHHRLNSLQFLRGAIG
jgi:hypothetical protein